MEHSEHQHKTLGQRLARNLNLDEIDRVAGESIIYVCDGTGTTVIIDNESYGYDCNGTPSIRNKPAM